jgi:putative phage-type endonuclease
MISEQQREARQHGIGGSDAPVIVGASPYKSAVELWQEKTGQVVPPDLSDVEVVAWGNLLEATVADEFSRRTGIKVRRVNETIIDRREPYLMANIDRRVVGAPEVVEIKTVRGLADDTPRADHLVQVQHYMHVGDFQRGWLVYLIAGQRLAWFEVKRDQGAIDELLAAERIFWQHVRERTAPAPKSAFDLRLLYPTEAGGSVIASDEVIDAATRLAGIKSQIKTLEAEADAAEKKVLEAMNDNATLLSPEGEILATWKQAKPSRSFDRARLEAEHPEIAATYYTEKAGSRRFLLKLKEAA